MSAPQTRSKLSVSQLEVGVSHIVPSDVVRNIGAFFDRNLNMQHHVKQLCRKTIFQLWNIGRIRHLLNTKTAETLVHAYITSRLDCGNALPHGVPGSLLRQLQSVQNTEARIVTRAGKQAHSKDLLEQLHWLPVSFRVDYKILLLTFRALHGLAPVYLSQLLTTCLQTYQDPPLPFPATAPPAQEQAKGVWRAGFLSRSTTPLECITQRSAGCELP